MNSCYCYFSHTRYYTSTVISGQGVSDFEIAKLICLAVNLFQRAVLIDTSSSHDAGKDGRVLGYPAVLRGLDLGQWTEETALEVITC